MLGASATNEETPSISGKPCVLQEQFIGDQDVAAFNERPEITLDACGIHKRVLTRSIDLY